MRSRTRTSRAAAHCVLGVTGEAKPRLLAPPRAPEVRRAGGCVPTDAFSPSGGPAPGCAWFWQFSHLHADPHGAPACGERIRTSHSADAHTRPACGMRTLSVASVCCFASNGALLQHAEACCPPLKVMASSLANFASDRQQHLPLAGGGCAVQKGQHLEALAVLLLAAGLLAVAAAAVRSWRRLAIAHRHDLGLEGVRVAVLHRLARQRHRLPAGATSTTSHKVVHCGARRPWPVVKKDCALHGSSLQSSNATQIPPWLFQTCEYEMLEPKTCPHRGHMAARACTGAVQHQRAQQRTHSRRCWRSWHTGSSGSTSPRRSSRSTA